ncbi:HD domain-containing protein [Streptomyces sp. NPDC097619]|uniref:HD-GYP domain-containing protein n=1 Tax=Streptomyces sp. NPDC097619 TaxID=3157228 RepID=UPI00331962A7
MRSPALLAVRAAAGTLAAAALLHTCWYRPAEPGPALAFGLLIALGELARRELPAPAAAPAVDTRRPAPLASAGALAYALLGQNAGQPTHHGVLQVVAVVVAATLAGVVPHLARGRGPALDHLAGRVLTVTFAALCFQPLYDSGHLAGPLGRGPLLVPFLLLVLGLTALCGAVLAALATAARTGLPYGRALREELRALAGIGPAVYAAGAVLAVGVAGAGLWALPVLCVPLLLTQLSFHRIAAVRATRHETIGSLARATEIAGYTRPGHARRVAALSREVGRELGLPERELTVLEYAALMHDIGQLSLVDPVPGGATAGLPAGERRRIAALGGEVARRTGVPRRVAVVVERQAEPYRDQPRAARIVRAANAYEDLVGGARHPAGSLAALEQLRLGTGHEYQPEVVEALARVLRRGGRGPREGAGVGASGPV